MIVLCAFCSGTGVQPHSLKMACFSCRGKGKVEFEHAAIMCSACKGRGRVSGFSVLSCIQCRGVGMVGGVHEGKRIGDIIKRFSGAGKWIRNWLIEKTLKTRNIVKGMFGRIMQGLSGAGQWIRNRLIKEVLWFRTIIYKIKRHS